MRWERLGRKVALDVALGWVGITSRAATTAACKCNASCWQGTLLCLRWGCHHGARHAAAIVPCSSPANSSSASPPPPSQAQLPPLPPPAHEPSRPEEPQRAAVGCAAAATWLRVCGAWAASQARASSFLDAGTPCVHASHPPSWRRSSLPSCLSLLPPFISSAEEGVAKIGDVGMVRPQVSTGACLLHMRHAAT